jgi:hypothetical protein
MPWTVDDVDKHKKGLSDKQKKQWVRIANAVLAKCMKDGGTDETCAPKAIKQANGVLNANSNAYAVYKNRPESDYEVTLTVHQDKPCYVVPVVMMVEGVHHGSHGPLLHKIDELGKIPASWDGIPVVIDHPENNEGTPISANSPEVIDSRTVGRVYNTNVDGSKLRAEAWLDEDKLNSIAPEILEDIINNKLIEVSVGVFSEEIEEEGTWNGEEYKAIASNYRPDHLAILTEFVGACSCEDGCGLRNNKQNDMVHVSIEGKLSGRDLVIELNRQGLATRAIGNHADAGYKEKLDAVYSAFRAVDGDEAYSYLEEMFDTYVIFSKSSKGVTKMYKQDYSFESGKLELTGNPVEVHRKVEYVTNNLSTNKKEVKMSKECAPCIKEKVDALIANSQGRWTENDREFLQTLSEDQLEKMKPIEVVKEVEKKVEVNKLTPQQEADLAFVANMRAERKRTMISEIQANTEQGTWTEEGLNKMDDDTLVRVHKSVQKKETHQVVDYSLGAGAPIINAGEEEILTPAGIDIE